MSNTNNKIINKKTTFDMSVFYLVILGVIFVAILVTSLFLIFKPFNYKKLDDLKETNVANVLKEKPKNASNSYYVLIYEEGSYKNDIIEKAVLDYANYAKREKDAKPLYRLSYDEKLIGSLASAVGSDIEGNIPMLILVEKGAVSTSSTKKTPSEINTLLDSLRK